MVSGRIGLIVTAGKQQGRERETIAAGAAWCADNGAFGEAGYIGDVAYLAWLDAMPRAGCLFVTAPDVVCDHQRTYRRSDPLMGTIRDMGYPVAFVAQNGAHPYNVPWQQLDVLFLGGDTEWKLGPVARELAAHAVGIGKRVHMGRVNSRRRLAYADAIGCDTADGTFLTFAPDHNLPRMESWLRAVVDQEALW